MPTLSKLIAAVFFAAVAYLSAEAFRGGMPEGTQFGQFNVICAVIGLICGWRVMGNVAGKGYSKAAGSGMRTSVTFTAWALLIFSVILMVRKAFKMRYGDSPLEAIVDIFSLALTHGKLVLRPEVLFVLIVGGILGGLVTEWVKKRWD